MEKNKEMTRTVEKPDSIKVSRNAKGQHAVEQKRYFNSDETPAKDVIDAMKATEDNLVETFDRNIQVKCKQCGKILFEGRESEARHLVIYCEKCFKNGAD